MLIYDRQIKISTAGSRNAKYWQPQLLFWSELLERVSTPSRSTETLATYLKLSKPKQDELKDVGGFVAGTLKGNRRKADAVLGRDVLTLDMDNIPAGGTYDTLCRIAALGCGYAVYSTRKHEEAKPRLRVLFPLNRTASADEYEPLARKMASLIGLELCDQTTFQAHRLMYWPSCCVDSQYVFTYEDKPFLDTDGVLGLYNNWRNITEWPQLPGVEQAHLKIAAKQGDPEAKEGVVGAFCRVYDIYRAMDAFIPEAYTPTEIPGRYTYVSGSTTGGAIIYENGKFLFSHHATDPVSGRLVNAFDLVRLHKYAEMDDDAKPDTPTNKLPSYNAMCQLAVADPAVSTLLNQERYEKATTDFEEPLDDNANWMSKLQTSSTSGLPLKTIDNVLLILENDPLLKDKMALDEFANRGLALGALPWDARTERRTWTDTDDAGIMHHLEHVYGIQISKDRMYAAMALCAHKHRINDVQDYLTGLSWDGVRRIDTLLTDYLGAVDTAYTRAVIRKALTAAVARVMTPGCKYDYTPILSGPQGIGKSTFLRLLGRKWYSDNLQTFEGKDAAELLQGVWIIELGELNGLSRAETNAVKQFLSRTEDIYREPYGRRTNNYPRRCVFFGTTNDTEFLKDHTGNRRFWPVDVGILQPVKSVFKDLEAEVDLLWAEAFVYWQAGESLYLYGDAEAQAKEEQESHREQNIKEGIIREFIERPLPENWDKRSLGERRLYWSDEFGRAKENTVPRYRVCAAEIWCECFNGDLKYMKRQDAVEINNILSRFVGWKRHDTSFRTGCYGLQRGFIRLQTLSTMSTFYPQNVDPNYGNVYNVYKQNEECRQECRQV
jgi:putative DNA primase/helicase